MVLGFSRCLHRLARFVSGLYVCIVRFPHILSMFLVTLLQKTFKFCIWTFERWIYFFFLNKKLLIEWRCFFTKWNCCMFWYANTYAVRNLLCIHLLPFFIFSAICVIAMLPYFLHCFWALLAWFFGPNSSLLHVLMCVRLLWYHWLVFLQFSSPYFASSCAPRFLNVLFCQKQFVLWCSWIFLCDLVARVSDCFLL